MKSKMFLNCILATVLSSLASDATANLELDELKLDVFPTYNLFDSSDILQVPGIKVTLGSNSLYGFVSAEGLERDYGGQDAIKMTLWGIGVGAERSLMSGLRLYFDAGLFKPTDIEMKPSFPEAAHYAFAKALGIPIGVPEYYFWEHYGWDVKPGFGGSIGLLFYHQLSSKFSIFGGTGYRYLKLVELIYGWNGEYDKSEPHWEISHSTKYSGFQLVFFGFSYKFR